MVQRVCEAGLKAQEVHPAGHNGTIVKGLLSHLAAWCKGDYGAGAMASPTWQGSSASADVSQLGLAAVTAWSMMPCTAY